MAVVAGSNGRKLQKRSVRSDGWTRARRALFLAEFAATCNTRASAAKAGMSERSVRALCRRDPQFAALCEEALQDGYRRLEAELLARALGEQPEDENPLPAECEPQPPSPRFDPQMAVKVLQLRNAGASALPQVLRDGFVHFDAGEDAVDGFDDVLFPLALGREAEVAPGFSTAIVTSAGGREKRNASWAEARTRYDVGPGIRSEADIAGLLDFFRARMGPARGFRLRDPFDADSGAGTPLDQQLGVGDGTATRFALVKHYGAQVRRITRPVAGSVRVAVDGVETGAFTLEDGGWVALDTAPAAGAVVTAGFGFDVPVRFAEDALSVSRATFLAGAAASVPLVEIRED